PQFGIAHNSAGSEVNVRGRNGRNCDILINVISNLEHRQEFVRPNCQGGKNDAKEDNGQGTELFCIYFAHIRTQKAAREMPENAAYSADSALAVPVSLASSCREISDACSR